MSGGLCLQAATHRVLTSGKHLFELEHSLCGINTIRTSRHATGPTGRGHAGPARRGNAPRSTCAGLRARPAALRSHACAGRHRDHGAQYQQGAKAQQARNGTCGSNVGWSLSAAELLRASRTRCATIRPKTTALLPSSTPWRTHHGQELLSRIRFIITDFAVHVSAHATEPNEPAKNTRPFPCARDRMHATHEPD
jgi:hypothetical protein